MKSAKESKGESDCLIAAIFVLIVVITSLEMESGGRKFCLCSLLLRSVQIV